MSRVAETHEERAYKSWCEMHRRTTGEEPKLSLAAWIVVSNRTRIRASIPKVNSQENVFGLAGVQLRTTKEIL